MNNNKQYFISAPCGYGKTRYMINDIRTNKHQRYLVIQPTHTLIAQTVVDMLHAGITGIKAISDDTGSKLQDCINAISDTSNRVIICTAATGLRLSQCNFTDLIVYCDDIHDCTSTNDSIIDKISDKKDDINALVNLVQHDDYYSYTLNPCVQKSELKKSAAAQLVPTISHDKMYMLNDLSDESVQSVQMLYVQDITKMSTAKKVIWLRANFHSSMVYLCFRNKIDFTEIKLKSRGQIITPRLNIFYYIRTRFSSNYQHVYKEQVQQMLTSIRTLVTDINDAIYTCNKTYKNEYKIPGEFVSTHSAGVNYYKHAHNVIWFACMLPSPSETKLYQAVFGDHITADCIAAARCYDQLHQFVMRSNLRVLDSTDEVNLYVPDSYMAEYIYNSLAGYCKSEPIHLSSVVTVAAKSVGRPVSVIDAGTRIKAEKWIQNNKHREFNDFCTRAKKFIQKFAESDAAALMDKILTAYEKNRKKGK